MELRAAHAQPADARFCSVQPLLGNAVVRSSLGRNRGMGAGCRREAHCAGLIAGHVARQLTAGSTLLATVTLKSGEATTATSALSAGSTTITPTDNGNGDFLASATTLVQRIP